MLHLALIGVTGAADAATVRQPLSFAPTGVDQGAARRQELRAGDVVYIEQQPFGGAGVALTACAVIDAPPAEVWPVLRDCDAYDRFLPGVDRSTLRGRNGNVAECEAVIGLPFPLGEWVSLERAVESESPDGRFERRWSLERGTYRRLEGLWSLVPWEPGSGRTLLIYQLDMDPDTVIPDFLLRRAQSSTAPKVFAAIRERVRQCALPSPEALCRRN